MAEIFLGIVADDFTGASDAASMLAEAGVPTVLFNGIPDKLPALREDIRAIVVAEKTRTIPAEEAVKEMLAAFDWLRALGAKQLYFKYCATFDSTEKGNIGPVADAVMKKYSIPYTVLAPALPVNGRTVRDGQLYVNGIPLSESHMRNHPLTPMRESDVCRLIEMQSAHKGYRVRIEELKSWRSGHAQVASRSSLDAETRREKYYLVPDYYENAHGDLIAETFGTLPFLTGGSGLCGALGRRYVRLHPELQEDNAGEANAAHERRQAEHTIGETKLEKSETLPHEHETLLLAGSCSKITLEQIADYQEKGTVDIFIDPVKLVQGEIDAATIFSAVQAAGDAVLVYSSQKPEEMRKTQELGFERVSERLESTMGELAHRAVLDGYTRIISAGGETGGAVTKALGYTAFYIGKSVAPGVPIMTPVENPKLRLVLKSGGFGQKDFFERAVKMTEDEK